MILAITGITGNMGQATLDALETAEHIKKLKLLVHTAKKGKKLLKRHKRLRPFTEVIVGSIADAEACTRLAEGSDLVINLCAVIPPLSDQCPTKAIECNQIGTDVLVSAIERMADRQPRLVHISTMALYGNRTAPHQYGRVGDPLPVSPFDLYAATKLRGEFRVLESAVRHWAVLRQTAMLHPNMLSDNIHDGLMFHTCFDAPLEWVTAHDSGLLVRNLVERFATDTLPESFWKRCYNIGGGAKNQCYGFDTLNDGFAIIGGSAQRFFRPGYNATRNFHGCWFTDAHQLNDLFAFQQQDTADYWKEILRLHPAYRMGKIVPKRLIAQFAVKRLLKDPNAPAYWAKHGDEARLAAYFGSKAAYDALQTTDWKNVSLPQRAHIDAQPKDEVFYGFDFSKPDEAIDLADLQSVAEAHGGRLIDTEFTAGDVYRKLEWETQDGERFTAAPYTVLRAGHWYNPIYRENVWDFDRLAKKDRILASVWYDSHGKDENRRYRYDEHFCAHVEPSGESIA